MGKWVLGLESGCTAGNLFDLLRCRDRSGCHEYRELERSRSVFYPSSQDRNIQNPYPESKIQDLPQQAVSYDMLQEGIAFLIYRTTRCGVN